MFGLQASCPLAKSEKSRGAGFSILEDHTKARKDRRTYMLIILTKCDLELSTCDSASITLQKFLPV